MRNSLQRPFDEAVNIGGRVTLAGAGPGDPELLTMKAIRAMQTADMILFDALVSEEILAFARSTAKRMLVGKRGHRPSCRQDDINALMLTLAKQGKHVVRLKSGDPSLFGRAGEEIAYLSAAGIPVTVVPGITSASAMAASMKLSLTHRDQAQSVHFVTGHTKNGTLPDDLDWAALASSTTTLVVYMGGRTGPTMAKRLIEKGMAEEMPCVVAISISRPCQHIRQGTLGSLANGELATVSDGPVLIGIGNVFAAADAAHATELFTAVGYCS